MRIDVIKPTAPIETVNPEDILATVIANKNGDPETMAPTLLTARIDVTFTPTGGLPATKTFKVTLRRNID